MARIVDGKSRELAVVPLSFTKSLDLHGDYLYFVVRCLVDENDLVLKVDDADVSARDEIRPKTYLVSSPQGELSSDKARFKRDASS